MSALPAPVVADDAGYEDDMHAAAWRDAIREYVLTRPAHALPLPPRWRRWGWLLALALHVLILIAWRSALHEQQPASDASVISVELFDAPAEPALPEPAAPLHGAPAVPVAPRFPTTARAPIVQSRAPRSDAPEVPPEVHAYNPDGSIDIPDDLASQLDRAQPRADFTPLQVAPSPILNPRRPLKVRPNHFAQYWNGTDGMPLHEAMWRYVTVTKEFVAPWGGHYGCAWILILVACADIPDKPWNPPQTWQPAAELDAR